MKQKSRWKVLAAVVGLCLLTACGRDSDSKVVFTTGFKENEIFKIGEAVCTTEELMVYLRNTRNQYEDVYGEEIWQTQRNGVTLEENVKETMLARIAQVKTMYLMAVQMGVTLTEQQESAVKEAAAVYVASLPPAESETVENRLDLIEQMYREYAMAQNVYDTIIQDIHPEISDDEARIITVQQIFLPFTKTGEDGKQVLVSEAEKTAVYQEAIRVRGLAMDGKSDFEKLAMQYSKEETVTLSFGKEEQEESLEEVAFSLETNEISRVIEGKNGYYILKCISTFNREETDSNKIRILEKRRKDAFEEAYDAFVKTLIRQLNEEAYERIDYLREERVSGGEFFEIFKTYVGE